MLNIINVIKSIKTKTVVFEILRGITIKIEKAEMVAVMGPSGCGKSTLLGVIAGLDKPSAGRVMIDGIDLYGLNSRCLDEFRHNRIGFVFQNFGLIKELTCEENILIPTVFGSKGKHTGTGKSLENLLEFLDIKHLRKRFPVEMSGGEQQRTAIARALIADPDIILADEPTGALDQQRGAAIMSLFRKIADQEKKTLLIVTHDKVVADHCDRVVHMKDGILADGAPTS
jgi:putative ABC transport system ATP-binding protein